MSVKSSFYNEENPVPTDFYPEYETTCDKAYKLGLYEGKLHLQRDKLKENNGN